MTTIIVRTKSQLGWLNLPHLPQRDYVTFGSLLSQIRLSVCRL